MKLAIVTDSTSDLPPHLIERYALEIVPTILILDGNEYADGKGISRDDFYTRLPTLQTQPTTAAPSIGDFSARYDSLLTRGYDHILSIHASEKLTAILNVSRQAAHGFPGKVTHVDSRFISLGLGFQVLAAADVAEQGVQAAVAAAESTYQRARVYAALDTMEYARRSGRLPAAVTFFGGMLKIKPILELADGYIKPAATTRTTKQANERILDFLLKEGNLQRLAILHTGAEARAKEFLETVKQQAGYSLPDDVLMLNVTTVIGTHVGPNGLGFASVRV